MPLESVAPMVFPAMSTGRLRALAVRTTTTNRKKRVVLDAVRRVPDMPALLPPTARRSSDLPPRGWPDPQTQSIELFGGPLLREHLVVLDLARPGTGPRPAMVCPHA